MTDHHVTRDGYARLEAALQREHRRLDEARRVVREQLEANEAENLGLVEAQEHLASITVRIEELEDLLQRAVIVDGAAVDVCGIGSAVLLKEMQSGRELKVRLVSPVEAEVAERGAAVITSDSPVGKALLGRRAGETVSVSVGTRVVSYLISSVDAA